MRHSGFRQMTPQLQMQEEAKGNDGGESLITDCLDTCHYRNVEEVSPSVS